jgi:hypothetical protein
MWHIPSGVFMIIVSLAIFTTISPPGDRCSATSLPALEWLHRKTTACDLTAMGSQVVFYFPSRSQGWGDNRPSERPHQRRKPLALVDRAAPPAIYAAIGENQAITTTTQRALTFVREAMSFWHGTKKT